MNPEHLIIISACGATVAFVASFIASMEEHPYLAMICSGLSLLFASTAAHRQYELALERIVTGTHRAALVEFTVDLNGDTINRVYGLVEMPISVQDSIPSPSAEP
jgi:hypothetical protein